MVDPVRYVSFQPVLHTILCTVVCGLMHIKEPMLLIRKCSPCGSSRFHLVLSEWSFYHMSDAI